MDDLLSKEKHCYKIHASLTKSAGYPPSLDNPLKWITPQFLQENLDTPSMIFQQSQPPINKGRSILCTKYSKKQIGSITSNVQYCL